MLKYLNIISNKQKFLEFSAIFLIFVAVGFRFGSESAGWFWKGYPFVAMIFVIIALLLSLLWVRIEKRKTQAMIDQIKKANNNTTDIDTIHEKINSLTRRQREIFDLILEEKSNREIMDELVIELSTLKTHINHIYKTLGIANRKEAKTIGKLYNTDQT